MRVDRLSRAIARGIVSASYLSLAFLAFVGGYALAAQVF